MPLFQEKQIKSIVYQILLGLNHVHSNGIVHRDLKPGNIMVDKKMKVKLIDFGLSKNLNNDPNSEKQSMGTPIFMAPEIYEKYSDCYQAPIDIWALGITMF